MATQEQYAGKGCQDVNSHGEKMYLLNLHNLVDMSATCIYLEI